MPPLRPPSAPATASSADSLTLMRAQETLQRSSGDTFFGVDKAEVDRRRRVAEMESEDTQSTFREECERLQALHGRWSAVRDDELSSTQHWLEQEGVADRADYLDQFRGAHSSDLVVGYDWPAQPTRLGVPVPAVLSSSTTSASASASASASFSASGVPMAPSFAGQARPPLPSWGGGGEGKGGGEGGDDMSASVNSTAAMTMDLDASQSMDGSMDRSMGGGQSMNQSMDAASHTSTQRRAPNMTMSLGRTQQPATGNGYSMDAVYDPMRVESPATTFHQLNPLRTAGRRGRHLLAAAPMDYHPSTNLAAVNDKHRKSLRDMHQPRYAAELTAGRSGSRMYSSAEDIEQLQAGLFKNPLEDDSSEGGGASSSTSNATPATGGRRRSKPRNVKSGGRAGGGMLANATKAKRDRTASQESKGSRGTPARGGGGGGSGGGRGGQRAARVLDEDEQVAVVRIFDVVDWNKAGSVRKRDLLLALRLDAEASRLATEAGAPFIVRALLRDRQIAQEFKRLGTARTGMITLPEWVKFVQTAATSADGGGGGGGKGKKVMRDPALLTGEDPSITALRAELGDRGLRSGKREMRSLAKPSVAVARLMEAVALLFGAAPGWKTAQNLLGDEDFLPRLQVSLPLRPGIASQQGAKLVPLKLFPGEAVLRRVGREYVSSPEFRPPVFKALGGPFAALLCRWVIALVGANQRGASTALGATSGGSGGRGGGMGGMGGVGARGEVGSVARELSVIRRVFDMADVGRSGRVDMAVLAMAIRTMPDMRPFVKRSQSLRRLFLERPGGVPAAWRLPSKETKVQDPRGTGRRTVSLDELCEHLEASNAAAAVVAVEGGAT